MAKTLRYQQAKSKPVTPKEEVLHFYQCYKDEIDSEIENNWDKDFLTNMLFHNGCNFNNADPTSGMFIYSQDEIQEFLTDIFEYLKLQEDRCQECARVITDFIVDGNSVPYGETFVTENISIGYTCSCGSERYW